MDQLLNDVDVRVLGALIEKEITTPDYYPLSLHALTTACNQTSNRHPVVSYDEATVSSAIDRLRRASLVRGMQRADSRVTKYSHLLVDAMSFSARELAVMGVLMLRGPQTVAEVRTRTARLAEFGDVADVEATLAGLIDRALVVRLPRQTGQKELRYAHLLSGEVTVESAEHGAANRQTEAEPHVVRIGALETAMAEMQNEIADIRKQLEDFRRQFE
ncbi:MAG: YceH family protein [Gemmatimonadaceae bacterium]